jgi:hypothetical protein
MLSCPEIQYRVSGCSSMVILGALLCGFSCPRAAAHAKTTAVANNTTLRTVHAELTLGTEMPGFVEMLN